MVDDYKNGKEKLLAFVGRMKESREKQTRKL